MKHSSLLVGCLYCGSYPVSILHKSIAGRYLPVRVADGPITARCGFIKNASWVCVRVVGSCQCADCFYSLRFPVPYEAYVCMHGC